MKVILKQEVDNLGLAGDVVDVAPGYGRNFLLPRGLAIKATRNAEKEAATITRARKAREAHTLDDATEQKEALESRTYRIPVRVDEGGHLYGSVRVDDVYDVVKERGHEIEKRRIDLGSPIKTIGTYEIDVHVHPQVTATIEVEVVDEEGRVEIDASGAVVDTEDEATQAEEAASLEERALEAAEELDADKLEELEQTPEGVPAIDPAAIDPDQPARPDEVVEVEDVDVAEGDEA